jgi:hypothetical protein
MSPVPYYEFFFARLADHDPALDPCSAVAVPSDTKVIGELD